MNITSTGGRSFSRLNRVRRTSICMLSVSCSMSSSTSIISVTRRTSRLLKPLCNTSSSSFMALRACSQASTVRTTKANIAGRIGSGISILRPSIRPAISLARLATLSCTLSSSNKSERGTGKYRLLGRCTRTSRLSLSASFSRRTISRCTLSTRSQSSSIIASKKGTRRDAHSQALAIWSCMGPMGERPNRLTKGFRDMGQYSPVV